MQRGRDPRLLALGREVESRLVAHRWPGNVRELENAIERAVVLSDGTELHPDDLLFDAEPAGPGDDEGVTLQARLDAATRQAIAEALEAAGGVKGDAAKQLGIDRTTLYRLMRKFGENA